MSGETIDLVIDRREWLRGEGSVESYLLRGDGKLCCLGILGRKLGIADEYLAGRNYPRDLPLEADLMKYPEALHEADGNLNLACRIADTNDSEGISDAVRERDLVPLMLEAGIVVTFTDGELDDDQDEEEAGAVARDDRDQG